ncbi:sugar porter family MFS transporter [Prolixibacteraceae bacterium Z1-6]|uniref:Sugar porter family MFS transporter n=1 Tax=Draconibacterium aestuarii TaxID=2998507 RepID=A0A9X3F8C7_9BACT|nr:sugar porter family MFS transporter [Prolixibacteraceae bacterium Z1-6]
MPKNLFLYTIVAALGGFLFGFDTAVINGALPFFRDHFELDKVMEGWAMSSAIFGCIIGAIGVGRLGDKYGRRAMLKITALLFLISALGTGLAGNISFFIIFRIIGGLAVGGASVLSPMYISEVAPPKYRGRFTILFQLSLVIGILVAFATDLALINSGINNWRWMFISEAAPATLFFVLLFFVGRSPRWLVKKGLNEEAQLVIDQTNAGNNNVHLLEEIQNSIDNEVVEHIKYLFKKPFLRLVIIGVLIGMFNQFTGIAVVMIYSSDIFRAAGFGTESAILQTVIVGFTNLGFTILAMAFIDKIGRKIMLLLGSVGMTIFLGIFSYIFLFNVGGFMPLVFMIAFVACFAFSQGAVVWVLFAEMFPNNIRSRGVSIGSFSHWVFYAILLFLFPVIQKSFNDNRGIGYVFAFFAVFTFISFFFFKKYIVETKGKTLEELERDTLKQ